MTRRFVVLPLLAVLAGCAGSDDEVARPCPDITVLADAAAMTRFAPGAGQDLTDVEFEAQITDVLSRCDYSGDPEDHDLAVLVALTPVITASRGPANTGQVATLDYFVSVVDQSKTVLNKQQFSMDIVFPENRSRVVVRDEDPLVTVQIPLQTVGSAGAYRLYVGLQLSEAELDYSRRRSGSVK
ncbi:MAG: hypothetical protein IPM60_10005 [Rhodospirillales bacterium]|nr:hypothetical protein [Rhodospirillales bacterium]